MQTGLTDQAFVNPIRILQLASTFFIFFLPALATARILDRRPFSWLGYNRLADVRVLLMAMALMALSIPVVGMLSDLNEMIPVPSGMEAVFQSMEDAYERQVKVMTRMNGWGDYLFSLLVMALGPAIFEETFFRGGMQRIIFGMTGRLWTSVIITALVFSAVHFSYFGFIPRVVLGIVLGLLYQHSGSLWTSIAAHFLNNAVVVTIIFVYTLRGRNIVPWQTVSESPAWIRKIRRGRKDGWHDDGLVPGIHDHRQATGRNPSWDAGVWRDSLHTGEPTRLHIYFSWRDRVTCSL